jgi:hypothetical protein
MVAPTDRATAVANAIWWINETVEKADVRVTAGALMSPSPPRRGAGSRVVERAVVLGDLPLSSSAVFAAYHRLWAARGCRVRPTTVDGRPRLTATDPFGFRLVLWWWAERGKLVLSVGCTVNAPVPAWTGWVGFLAGLAAQVALAANVIHGTRGDAREDYAVDLTGLYVMPNVLLVVVLLAVGTGLAADSRFRMAGAGLLLSAAAGVLLVSGVCSSVG